MIVEEDQRRPLSDQEIASTLRKDHGLVIARRTVAKYRKIIKVPPANKRKSMVSGRNHT
jgi:RNA polymerase sigma-54 factor